MPNNKKEKIDLGYYVWMIVFSVPAFILLVVVRLYQLLADYWDESQRYMKESIKAPKVTTSTFKTY